jgi:proline dehydrogenase
MLRSLLVSLSKNGTLKKLVMNWRPARAASRRFVAGETLQQAIDVVKELNGRGIIATLDQLGENTIDEKGALDSTQDVMLIVNAINQNNLRANVSVKLSQIGLNLDVDFCRANLEQLLAYAQKNGVFVRIDMEGSDLTEKTFNLYQEMIQKGYPNVGIVLQSYLYRTEKDVERLLAWNGRVRLCKGAYIEPESIAFPQKAQVDANFDLLAKKLLEASSLPSAPRLSADGRTPAIAALATHDEKRILAAKQVMQQLQTPSDALEFQMLHGIRRDLQASLAAEGYPVRVYIPFGTQWYPYFMRRLAERPANLWFFVSNFFRK